METKREQAIDRGANDRVRRNGGTCIFSLNERRGQVASCPLRSIQRVERALTLHCAPRGIRVNRRGTQSDYCSEARTSVAGAPFSPCLGCVLGFIGVVGIDRTPADDKNRPDG
jgi:hypothetical protein